MRVLFTILWFISIPFSTKATTNESAAQLCNELHDNSGSGWSALSDKKQECSEFIDGKEFSESAVQLCRELYDNSKSSWSTLSDNRWPCLQLIAGKKIDDSDIQGCRESYKKSNSAWSTLSDNRWPCLQKVIAEMDSNLVADHPQPSTEKQIQVNPQTQPTIDDSVAQQPQSRQAKNTAIEFCRNDVPSYNKDKCLNIVTSSRFVDIGAFSLCKKNHNTSSRALDCLSAIVDRHYVLQLIEECSEKSIHEQVDCLHKYGSPIDLAQSVTIVINIGTQAPSRECIYSNFSGRYPEGGGCNFHGCWVTGGGCNFDGCWYPGGSCSFDGCTHPAPADICE